MLRTNRSLFFMMFSMLTLLLIAGFSTQLVGADDHSSNRDLETSAAMTEEQAVQSPDDDSSDKVLEAATSEEVALQSPTGIEYWASCNYSGLIGRRTLRCFNPNIRANSYIQVSVSEGSYGNRHMGAADFTVLNVVPKAGYVDVRINVGWHYGLLTVLDLNWFNP